MSFLSPNPPAQGQPPSILRTRHHPASALNSPQSSSIPLTPEDEDDKGEVHEPEGIEQQLQQQHTTPLPAISGLNLEDGGSDGLRGTGATSTGTGTPTTSITFSEPPSVHGHPLGLAPTHSILRPSSSDPSPPGSQRSSLDGNDTAAAAATKASSSDQQQPERLRAALLKPPGTEATGSDGQSSTAASSTASPRITGSKSLLKSAGTSRNPSPSPTGDRTRIVGKGGYGGRKGGPSMTSKRTSSSGGLSDVDMRPGYERKVGFDTMRDADETNSGSFSFTLQVKSIGYLRTKNTRTFMCAVDDNSYSERALEWLVDGLVEDGDEVVALRVLEGDADEIDQDEAREEARELMASIVQLNDEVQDRSISIVVEFVAGRVTSTILRLIHMYRPDSLTVGTKGKTMSAFQKMLGGASMGSCSRDILNRSPVPVVIVRPEAKVRKHLAKRANDPKRRSYHDLVSMSREDSLPLTVGSRHKSAIRRAKKS